MMILACWFAASAARGAELNVPAQVPAGQDLAVPTSGSGQATMYLVGPAHVLRKQVQLGNEVRLSSQDLRVAGRYTLVIGSSSANFIVTPGKPERLSFLALPSRLPVALNNGISGVVYTFDGSHNLVLDPQTVEFKLAVADAEAVTRKVQSKNGVAWIQLDSTRKAGQAQFVATLGAVSERRIVQETPADPCNLRLKVQRGSKSLIVETEPIKDCTGNPVPDGTIVTFTEISPQGKSSVDARIKRGFARAELPLYKDAVISVASGVVLGNEVRVRGGE
jgi:hypothetical protein